MGKAKHQLELGFTGLDDTYVCTECFEDYGLKKFISSNCDEYSCSFCEDSRNYKCCEYDILIEHIVKSLNTEWGDPANEGLPWESREGGWQFGDVTDTFDLLCEVGIPNQDLFDAILSSVGMTEWCEINPYSLSNDKILLYGWKSFSDFVRTKARYVFFKAPNSDYDENQHDEMNPVDILQALQMIINDIDLFDVIKEQQKIRRVRIVDSDTSISTAQELGSPPYEYATMPNRMSPAGIPMFYGAFSYETALAETYQKTDEEKKAVCGVFQPTRPLNVVDLSKKLHIPSIYDEEGRESRTDVSFL